MSACPLPPGSTIGILGGGQLGRMLAAGRGAARLQVAHLFRRAAAAPAFEVARCAARSALLRRRPRSALCRRGRRRHLRIRERAGGDARRAARALKPVLPPGAGLRRRAGPACGEGLPQPRSASTVAPYAAVDSLEADLAAALAALGPPAILKTRAARLRRQGPGRSARRARRRAAWRARPKSPASSKASSTSSARSRSWPCARRDGALAVYDLSRTSTTTHPAHHARAARGTPR